MSCTSNKNQSNDGTSLQQHKKRRRRTSPRRRKFGQYSSECDEELPKELGGKKVTNLLIKKVAAMTRDL